MIVAKRLTLVLALVTIALLDLVLALGNGRGPAWIFEPSTDALAWCLFVSSALFGYIFFVSGRRALGAVFLLNAASGIAGAAIAMGGTPISVPLLFVADVVWLTLYLIVVTRYWSFMTGTAP